LRRQGRRGELTRQLAVDFAAERINVNALYRSLDCVQSLFPSYGVPHVAVEGRNCRCSHLPRRPVLGHPSGGDE
jgi:hypothetical protein